ncbi:hypothetical protein D9613_012363 [Agrocybe pediades]|uniref:BTB domain-containing protein n=1 Tax=Agrocybe pediades TaxID=84607 RepID=A0A8H4VMV7_9AGAR|nr:hypothetical protein D9613_012363 [Agrocybe pediades]
MLHCPPSHGMEDEAKSGSDIINSTSFWFDDGNLVLEVEDTRFRVHLSILSHHSSFFKDLSLIPQPVDSKEVTEDGTPILKIPYDRKEDWESILYVIYNPLESHDSSKKYTLQTLMALLRLSHKYQFRRFEELARDAVKQFIPLEHEE